MDKFIYNAFKNLPETEVPSSLHVSIVRAALFSRTLRYISILTFVTVLTFIVSLFHLHAKILETETLLMIKTVVSTLDFNLDSIIDATKTLLDFLPTQAIVLTLLNFIALVFMVLLFQSFKRLGGKFAV